MQKELEITRHLAPEELKDMANVEGPCITVFIPLQAAPNTSRFDHVRLNSAIHQADAKVRSEWPDKPNAWVRELIEPLNNIAAEADQWGGSGGSLIILRSPDVFRAFELQHHFEDQVHVGEYFHLFPVIRPLQRESQRFYVLALSQKNVRLLRCTHNSSTQVAFSQGTPTDLEEWLNTRMPNASPSRTGAHPPAETGATLGDFNSVHDRDNKDEHIANFFHVIDRAVFDMLHEERAPLVLCGVEYLRSMYEGLSQYKHLVNGVQGSPESLKGGELHARALEAVQGYFTEPARKALAQWDKLGGGGRTLTSLPEIVKAAFEARIAQLFALENAQAPGVFDRESMQIRKQGRQTDLVNAAALKTLAFGGDVFIVAPEDMPGDELQIAAITRY